jgi:hypothetical protein
MSNELQKQNGGMEMMATMMGNIMPPNLPQHDFNKGLISGIFHNKKLEQLEKASALESQISANRLAMLQSNLGVIMDITTFSSKMKEQFEQFEFRKKEGELILMEKQSLVKNIMLEGQNMEMNMRHAESNFELESKLKEHQIKEAEYSSLTAELEFKLRLKEMEKGL